VEEITVADDATVAFPTFISVPFAADTTLDPFVAVNVELSANQEMTECATFSQTVARIGTGGMATTLGSRSFSDLTIPMSTDSGVTGFTDAGLLMAVTNGAMIQTGEGIAVTVKITNKCGADRTVWLAYDSLDAESSVRSVPVSEVEFKCQLRT